MMSGYTYKVVPAPTQGTKAKGVKSTEDRFALSMTNTLNEMAGAGWEYIRAETLPCDERKGLTGTQTTYQNVLIFRKASASVEAAEPRPTPLTLRAPSQPQPAAPNRDEPPLSRFPRAVDEDDTND